MQKKSPVFLIGLPVETLDRNKGNYTEPLLAKIDASVLGKSDPAAWSSPHPKP
jgi:hypothetical protein